MIVYSVVAGRELFVAGFFTTAGCQVSNGFARYSIAGTPFDFDGDGRSDFSVWRPSDGTWYLGLSSTGAMNVQPWGVATDKIVPADYDNDGVTDMAVYRPSEGKWYVIYSATSSINQPACSVL